MRKSLSLVKNMIKGILFLIFYLDFDNKLHNMLNFFHNKLNFRNTKP